MSSSPIAIGGIGGSGTRLIGNILYDLGFYLGDDLNRAYDNLWFTLLLKRRELWPLEEHSAEIRSAVRLFLNAMIYREPLSEVDEKFIREFRALSTFPS